MASVAYESFQFRNRDRLVFGTGEQKAYIRQISQAISCDIHPVTNLNILQHLVKAFGADEAQKNAWYVHFASSGVAAVEELLAQRGWHSDFALGNQISMADLCLIPQMYNLRRYKIPVDAYPLCCKIERNCIGLKPFQDAAPEAQPDAVDGLEQIHGAKSPLL
jgi:maleylacetoacetate isomerase/maleylpyruvate isomerase